MVEVAHAAGSDHVIWPSCAKLAPVSVPSTWFVKAAHAVPFQYSHVVLAAVEFGFAASMSTAIPMNCDGAETSSQSPLATVSRDERTASVAALLSLTAAE